MRNLIAALVFGALCFLAIELTYRVYAMGPGALRPAVMNSMTTILESGLVQPAATTDVWFELKPNLETLHNGAALRTNRDGLADDDYPREKPEGVFRIVVVGSSWTMPSGVPVEDAWHSVLERRLNELNDGRRYEVISFGVELYGLGELVGSLRHKAMEWQPDLVLAGVTTLTSYLVWDENQPPFEPPARRYPFYESMALSTLLDSVGITLYGQRSRPNLGADVDRHRAQTVQAIEAMHAISDAGDTPMALVWLGFRPLMRKHDAAVREVTERLGIPLIRAYEPVRMITGESWGDGFIDPRFRVNRFDNHPNALGHRLIGEVVLSDLEASGLLGANKNR